MAVLILVIAAVIEVVLGIYCLITKSNNTIIRSWIRIAVLMVFVILSLASVIEWNFRWIPLIVILLLWAAISGVKLIRNKAEQKIFKAKNVVFKAIAAWLVLAIAVAPSLIFPQYKIPDVTGKHMVNTVVYSFVDANRLESFKPEAGNRKVTVEFWYPTDIQEKCPLVVFSHGAFGMRSSNASTFKELASNGYIVCSIDHPYHSLFSKDTNGHVTTASMSFIEEVMDVNNGVYDEQTAFELEQKWLKVRTADINFVLDIIIQKTKNNHSSDVYQLINTNKIGLIGHSLGGAACVQICRERKDINAVINLDADLLGEVLGLKDGQYLINDKIYPVPILSIYTDDLKKGFDDVAAKGIVTPRDVMSRNGSKSYEVFITGTNHMSITDLPLISPFFTKVISSTTNKIGSQEADKYYVIDTMNKAVMDFFNCYLKDRKY